MTVFVVAHWQLVRSIKCHDAAAVNSRLRTAGTGLRMQPCRHTAVSGVARVRVELTSRCHGSEPAKARTSKRG